MQKGLSVCKANTQSDASSHVKVRISKSSGSDSLKKKRKVVLISAQLIAWCFSLFFFLLCVCMRAYVWVSEWVSEFAAYGAANMDPPLILLVHKQSQAAELKAKAALWQRAHE